MASTLTHVEGAHDGLSTLPDELLLEVASHLQEPDLCSLSLTSKHFGAIAQDALYRCVRIPYVYWSSPIAKLARIVTDCPHVARKILHLSLNFDPDPEEGGPISRDVGIFLGAPSTVGLVHSETEIVRYILTRLENLKSLSLESFRGWDARDVDMTRQLFGDGFRGPSAVQDLSRIAGLAKLRKLELRSNLLAWEWCELPFLKELWLGMNCRIGDYSAHSKTSMIETLGMECSIRLLLCQTYRHLPAFLGRLPMLTKICIRMNEEILYRGRFETDNAENPGVRYSNPIDALGSVAPILEYLSIDDYIGDWPEYTAYPSYLRYVDSVDTLVHYKRLKYLKIPQEALFGRWSHPSSYRHRLQTILPPSIVSLTLRWPFTSAIDWLEDIPPEKSYFSNLKYIGLVPRERYGNGYEEFRYISRSIWGQLEELGIKWDIRRHPREYREYREDWADEN